MAKSATRRAPRVITIDFETMPIEARPHYPPEPVGVSICLPGGAPKYYAWGHRTGKNNCSREDAARFLKAAYDRVGEDCHLLMHNAKFDLDVAEAHFGRKPPPWHQWHDTMFLLFLDDPHQRQLGLKPAAERLLGMPPEERDVVKDWVWDHRKQLVEDFPELSGKWKLTPSFAGACIAYAPANVVAPYANGDVVRTEKLFKLLWPRVAERGMLPAYDRERKILPILLENERVGLRADRDAMARDQGIFEQALERVDNWLRKKLGAPNLDFNKDEDVGEALVAVDAINTVSHTSTGRISVSKNNLKPHHFNDPKIAQAYAYRQRCATALETFLRPWQAYVDEKGWLHTNWNQVRQAKGGNTNGTRTGRPSSDAPNFLNMPKRMSKIAVPKFIYKDLPQLPKIRDYILPDAAGHLIGRRDYNQQELRVLAHFGDGALMAAYLKDPRLDVHQFLSDKILETVGVRISRDDAKGLNFGYIYGQGQGALAETLNVTVQEIQSLRRAQMVALPDLSELSRDIKQRVADGLPVRTWGAREYYVEPPVVVDGKLRDFTYKLINYLVQGSSADITKESIIRYHDVRKDGRFMLTVYDENNISVPAKALKDEMLILRDVMMSIELDVPLISDGEYGDKLGSMQALEEPEPNLSRWGIQAKE